MITGDSCESLILPCVQIDPYQKIPLSLFLFEGLFAPRMPRLGIRSFSGLLPVVYDLFAVNTLGRGKVRVLLIMVDLSGKLHEFRFPVRAAKAIMQSH